MVSERRMNKMSLFTFEELVSEKQKAFLRRGDLNKTTIEIKYAVIKDILGGFRDEDNATAYVKALDDRFGFFTPQGFPARLEVIYRAIEELEEIKDEITKEQYETVYE